MASLLLFAALIALAVASYFWGADSRPGFSDGRSDYVEHWFPHER